MVGKIMTFGAIVNMSEHDYQVWMVFDLETNNSFNSTVNPNLAYEWWLESRKPDSDFYIFPDNEAEILRAMLEK